MPNREIFLKSIWNIACFILLIFYSAKANEIPYSVTGVANNDSLNIRESDDSQSKIIGKIPFNGQGITVLSEPNTISTRLWGKIRYKNTVGWVNMKFLKKGSAVSLIENIRCIGTEPFWGMTFKNDEIDLNYPMDKSLKFKTLKIQQSENNTNQWFIEGQASEKNRISIYLIEQNCSDDMSDTPYKYRVLLNAKVTNKNITISGCCKPE